ncbi:MAG: hypothetical protein ACKN9T_06345 [Candidatus Methylumidiphilus sp.]
MQAHHHSEDNLYHRAENSSHEGKKKYQRRSSDRYWIAPLTVFLAVAVIIMIVLIYYLKMEHELNDANAYRIANLNQRLSQSKQDLEAAEHKLVDAIAGKSTSCIPNLAAIKYDEAMPIDKGYVKTGYFSVVGKKDKRFLEYRIALKNDTQKEITPKLDMLFFDKTSAQVGFFQTGRDANANKSNVLEKDEVRSVTGTIEIPNADMTPAYYLLRISEG